MDRKTLLWIVIGLLFIAVLYLTFQASSSAVTQGAVQGAVSSKAAAASSYGGMVGGC